MKADESDYKKYSDAIDRIQEGNDAMIELFNDMESDKQLISYSDDVIEDIERAKKKHGNDEIDDKINKVVREMLSWIDLDD